MASSTFLQLTNRLLRQFNEVEMTESDWAGAKGIQAFAKDAVKMAIQEIAAENRAWENTVTNVVKLIDAGTRVFNIYNDDSYEDTPKHIDVESFACTIYPLDDYRQLKPIDINEWRLKYSRTDLNDADPVEGQIPEYIYRIDATTWGLSPLPGSQISLIYKKYNYFTNDMEATSSTTIPENYEYVIHLGAMHYFNMLLDNQEQANLVLPRFEKAMKNMRIHVTNDEIKMHDTRVRF